MSLKRKSDSQQKSGGNNNNTNDGNGGGGGGGGGVVSIGNDIVALQASLLSRPARKQSSNLNSRYEDHDTDTQEYNIWYHKKLGKRNWRDRDVSDARCNVLKDCGKTRASKDSYFCLHFARGRCVNGVECTYLHRVPTPNDDKRLVLTHDIFGRERFRDDREDMGGVGSFSRDNRTLYIGGLKSNQNLNQLEDMIRRGFEEWGSIEYVRVILNKSIAFVRYMYRSTAEFAKEAMADQTLDNGELLNVRWATEDSNPLAKQADERNLHRVATEVVNKRLREMANDDQAALQFQMSGVYPNTDGQYDPNLLQQQQQQQQMYQYQYATSQRYEMHPYARRYNQQLQERQKQGDAADVQPLSNQVGNYYGHTPNEMNMSNDQKKQYDEYLKNYYQYYGFDYTQLTDEQKQQIQQYSQAYYGVSSTKTTTTDNNTNNNNNNQEKEDKEEEEEDDDDDEEEDNNEQESNKQENNNNNNEDNKDKGEEE
ncbi:pre-mRNA-splicing factor cwc2 [Heterostelium album PN500]|uniref:Pre-mRNA-splicing factor cwc2 n=1 Tax=Heterostelium pallidum (strain ATCC 26659 / Pp 5 / PN500) TaxID=670386 RepID=D3AYH7_HETP5|nr:pre-mRNA-splicing factor cwc2 [Heterostelium album PN500]EFA86004.1 pre-mRNA-splicing factor cwc2 [Heterostelium album PN500]|eukprot:XP_020438110.1 pre-mRNA-splicing factor cwc2 [Heterostelium album PN500]